MLNKIFSAIQIPTIDRYTIEHEKITSYELMERAASIWTDFFCNYFVHSQKIVVVVGNGNNGGDGFVVARLLNRQQKEVVVMQVNVGSLKSDCEMSRQHYLNEGGVLHHIHIGENIEFDPDAIVIDALWGTGLNRPVRGFGAEVIQKLNQIPNTIVSIDIPSGLMGEDNSFNCPNSIVQADYTFTFQFPKLAFMLSENALYVGRWHVLDIGLNQEYIDQLSTKWFYTTCETVKGLLPIPMKFAHKGINGKGRLIAGSYGMMGAAVLAAKSAIRSGIGLLACQVPCCGVDILQIAVPEAILVTDMESEGNSIFSDLKTYDAIAIGPGIGKSTESLEKLRNLLSNWKGPTILDADALNLLAANPELMEGLHRRCLLTPHMKEFERLVGKSKNDFDRLNKLSIFANQYQVYILLKGAHAVIATPDGELYFNMSGNPGMAKGGAGDVLTGVLLALAANGIPILDVARIGAFAHGLAGDLLQEECGCRGISSGALAEQMQKVWKVLEKNIK